MKNTHKVKKRENQSISNANTQLKNSDEPTFQFVDNREEAIVQQKLMNQTVQKKENNTGLPDNLKSGIENMSGYTMGDVKVHYNSNKPAQLNAHAYAQGTDIHLGSGQEKHLPHEAWHVVQQKQGRVQPTTSFNGAQINDNEGLENEADVMGGKALQMKMKHKENVLTSQLEVVAQRKLHSSQIQKTVQRILYHYEGAPFTEDEAETWNNLVAIADEFPETETYIEDVESDVYDATTGTTVTGSLAGLKALIRDGILTRVIDRNDANDLGWGEFAPMLADMATRYGVRTGPVATGGHAAQTYTYTYDGESVSIAEETNAHGQTQGNLNTRRGQMRNAIDLYNQAVNDDADQYV